MVEEADPHPELCDALVGFLKALVSGGEPLGLLADYQATLLASTGLWPDLTRCLLCNRPAPPGRAGYFSATQGGLICRDCINRVAEKCKVSGLVLDALRRRAFSLESAPGAFELLDYTIAHMLGRRPGLSRFIRGQVR